MMKLVVVAPTYNEEVNIENFIKAVLAQEKNLKDYSLELVISDSASKDETPQITRRLAKTHPEVHYLDVKKRGLGLGLVRGIDYAVDKLKADVVITMEADLSANPSEFPDFLSKLQKNDLVIGSRYVKGGKIENWTWWRRAFSYSANLILRFLAFAPQIHEFTNLYRAFKKDVWKGLRPAIKVHLDWIFVPAFVFESLNLDYKIAEQPMVLYDRFGGRSKMNTISYTINLLRYALRSRVKKSASFFKFLVVGTLGFIINTAVLLVGVKFGFRPSVSAAAGAELAIISNFIWNNFWTFSDRKATSVKDAVVKFIKFNVVSLGSVGIQFVFLRTGEFIFGLKHFKEPIIDVLYLRVVSWYMVFYLTSVALGLVVNFIVYNKIVWRKAHAQISQKQ